MSTGLAETLATVQAIVAAEVALVQISTIILLILGNIGEILNLIIFVQRTFRNNSCVVYFLAASCTRIFFINYSILISDLQLGYNVNIAPTSPIACKIRFYLFYIATVLPPSFIVLACFDRFMLSSSNANMRLWSQRRIAYRLVAVVFIFWLLFSIHAFFGSVIYSVSGYSYCSFQQGSYGLFVNLYFMIANYLLPPILMTILGLMTIANVRRVQKRIRPTVGTEYMQRKDRYLLRMLLFQVFINVVFTMPLAVLQVYELITIHWQKGLIQQAWELFFVGLSFMFFYIPYCFGFYVYTLTASIFRQELKRIFLQFYRRFICRRQTQVMVMGTNITQTIRN